MDVDGIIDSELHEEGRKQAAWEKAYNAALDRWEYGLANETKAKLIEDQIEGDLLAELARAIARRGDFSSPCDDAYGQARESWATEQARKEIEDA